MTVIWDPMTLLWLWACSSSHIDRTFIFHVSDQDLCALLGSNGYFHDQPCTQKRYYMCETEAAGTSELPRDAFSSMHYVDVITSTVASQITSLAIVHSTVDSGADQRKHQISASLAFVRGIHRGPVNSPHKGPVTRKMFSIWWRHQGVVNLIPAKCGMALLIHPQSLTVQPLKFGNGYVISLHSL